MGEGNCSASYREWWSTNLKSNDVRKVYWTPYAPLRNLQEPCKPNRWQFPTKYDDLIKNTYLHTKLMKIIDFNICIFLQSLKELPSFTINPEMRKKKYSEDTYSKYSPHQFLTQLNDHTEYDSGRDTFCPWRPIALFLSAVGKLQFSLFARIIPSLVSPTFERKTVTAKKNKSGGRSIEINQIRYKKSSRYTQKIYKALYRIKCSLS